MLSSTVIEKTLLLVEPLIPAMINERRNTSVKIGLKYFRNLHFEHHFLHKTKYPSFNKFKFMLLVWNNMECYVYYGYIWRKGACFWKLFHLEHLVSVKFEEKCGPWWIKALLWQNILVRKNVNVEVENLGGTHEEIVQRVKVYILLKNGFPD